MHHENPTIFAVMGGTGVGKSFFIDKIGAKAEDGSSPIVGDDLTSCTPTPKLFRIPGTQTYLIDTPGFDDTKVSDREMLRRISNVLQALHTDRTDIAGILYLHSIADDRMTGGMLKTLELFGKVVGGANMPRCILVTTKWSRVSESIGKRHEDGLRNNQLFWKPLLDVGAHYVRFEGSRRSAMQIMSYLNDGQKMVPKLVSEWASGKQLHETEAGRAVEDDVQRAKEVAEADIKDVRKEAAEAIAKGKYDLARTLEKERQALEEKVREMQAEHHKLRVNYEEQRKVQESQIEEINKKYNGYKVSTTGAIETSQKIRRGILGTVGSIALIATGFVAAPALALAIPLVAVGATVHEVICDKEIN